MQTIEYFNATPAGKHLASSADFCQDKNIDFLEAFGHL
jgi:hypothetical protein